jgi:PEP-CTERM motif
MQMLRRLALIIAMLLIPALTKADSVWTFDGELTDPGSWHPGFPFPHCNCDLDGTMVFDDSFNVLAYSWTDGTHTLDQNNSSMVFENNPRTDPNISPNPPPLSTWLVSITGSDIFFHTNFDGPGQGATSLNNSIVDNEIFGWGQPNLGPPGTWTEVVSTPEPNTLMLLGVGLIALVAAIYSLRWSITTLNSFGRLRA